MTTLRAIKELAEKATPGPWEACRSDHGGCECGTVYIHDTYDLGMVVATTTHDYWGKALAAGDVRKANQLYIAAISPEVIKALVAVAEAAEALAPVRTSGSLRVALDQLGRVLEDPSWA